jgi:hypothetical protein
MLVLAQRNTEYTADLPAGRQGYTEKLSTP